MSSILKQSLVDSWKSASFKDSRGTYTGKCPADGGGVTLSIGAGRGPDAWPTERTVAATKVTDLVYGGRGGFTLSINGYVDGTGLDIRSAASNLCADDGVDCTDGTDLTAGATVKVLDRPKPSLSKWPAALAPCPDKTACGTGAGGALPVLFVFGLMGKNPARSSSPPLPLSLCVCVCVCVCVCSTLAPALLSPQML